MYKRFSCVLAGLLILNASCAAQEPLVPIEKFTPEEIYGPEEVNQDLIDELESNCKDCDLVTLPTFFSFQDSGPEDIRDIFPGLPRRPKPDPIVQPDPITRPDPIADPAPGVKPITPDERIFDGEIIRKIKDLIIQSFDALTFSIKVTIWMIPVAIFMAGAGLFLYSGAFSANGISAAWTAIAELIKKITNKDS